MIQSGASRRPFNVPRRPSGARILGGLAALALAGWFGTMVYNFRVVGSAHALGVVTGTVLMALWAAIFLQRVLTASPPAWLRRLLADGEFVVGFVVFDLIVLNIFSPFFMPLSLVWPGGSILLLVLSFAGRLSGPVLFATFVVVTTALVGLILVRLARRLVPASPAVTRVQRTFRVAAVCAVALYGIYASVLSFNGSLDASRPVEHRRELVAVTTVNTPLAFPISWLDLRADDGTLERITLIVGKDGVWAGYVDPGQAVVVSVARGFFGIPWIERVALDADRQAELLVEAAPSAAVPRRALVTAYLRQGRRREAVDHTRAYLGYYPRDIAFAGTVAATLRSAGDVQSAFAVEQLAREAQSGG
jgi:hypothetical protein